MTNKQVKAILKDFRWDKYGAFFVGKIQVGYVYDPKNEQKAKKYVENNFIKEIKKILK